ncbi:MAG: DMT family transporter [Proteobacteria bacterium]|nr:DMT family transporter [Pseudomonadota bacterium]
MIKSPILRAALWMMGTLVAFSMVGVATRHLTDSGLPVFQILFLRATVGLVILSPIVLWGGWRTVSTPQWRLHAVRNTVHFGASYAWYFGIAVLPLANVFAIEFTAPIWVAVFAVLILGEKLNRGRGVAIALGLTGMLIILRPGLESFTAASLVVLISALGFACAHIATKELTQKNSVLKVLFWMAAMQFPMGIGPAIAVWTPIEGYAWLWTAAVGASAVSAHFCLTRALSLADASVVVPMDFLRIPLIAVVGLFVFGEAIDGWVIVGAAVIFAGTYYSIRHEHRGVAAIAVATPPLEVPRAAPRPDAET